METAQSGDGHGRLVRVYSPTWLGVFFGLGWVYPRTCGGVSSDLGWGSMGSKTTGFHAEKLIESIDMAYFPTIKIDSRPILDQSCSKNPSSSRKHPGLDRKTPI